MKKLESLDNITDEVLDLIVEKLGDKSGIRVLDDRETITFEKKREYFLVSNNGISMRRHESVEWTFIWIGKNLWQFTYCNTLCMREDNWKNPLDLLNELLELS